MKKTFLALMIFALAAAGAFAAVSQIDGSVTVPEAITRDSACPVVQCADGACHGFDNVPEPDGIHDLVCPKASCASAECHAWDSLLGRYRQASDVSLNLWILMPVAAVVGLVCLLKKIGEVSEG